PELEDITYSDDEDDVGAEADFNNLETSITVSPIPTRVYKDHHPKRVHQALKDLSWIKAMQKELLQFKMQKDERGIMVRNKARLVAQGHTQEEGINYEEGFTPVARIEAIRLFLAYASFMGFMVYQMDVKSAFLYGTIEEEVYVYQPPGFEDPDRPNKVYKVVNELYGLHQAPKAWKFRLSDGKLASTPIDTEKPLLKDPDEIGMLTLRIADVDLVGNNEALEINLDLLEERREEAAIRESKSKAKMEKYYNSKVRNTSFKPGDLVYHNNDNSQAKDTGKLGPKWEGPYEVTKALGKGAYKLRDRDGKQLSRT
nr:hypothetical protein [Tanacetum cinerariifolium]